MQEGSSPHLLCCLLTGLPGDEHRGIGTDHGQLLLLSDPCYPEPPDLHAVFQSQGAEDRQFAQSSCEYESVKSREGNQYQLFLQE